jgi:2-C-methyl-D-erythritol 2,4-cyclodiphosphate synthase
MRIGTGYDVHRLAEGRKLIIGGVDISFEKGLFGHSDADVLLHAICDAMLGAAGLGDIGRHFPDTAPIYKDISSLMLLEEVRRLLAEAGFRVNNVDATIVAEKPKMAPHIPSMVTNIAAAIKVDRSAINVKATTTEGLGFAGRGEGMAAYAVALIRKVE